jgi:Dolichyl-phosphate-mannose-protein mannosyltransferase
MRLVAPILANFLLIIAAFGLGSVLKPLLPAKLSKLDRITIIAVGGAGLLGTLLFLVGLLHFSRVVVIAVLGPGALVGLLSAKKELAEHLGVAFENPAIPVAIIVVILAVTFVGGLAQPVGDIKLDAIAYHFLGPRVWIRDASIHVLPDECLSAFPAVAETIYAGLMAIGGTRGPELFAFFGLGFLLMVCYGFAVRLGLNGAQAWWAAALVATMPVVYRGAYGGFVDVVFSAFLLFALRLALDAREWKEFALGGVFAGLAMGTKYTGVPAFILIVVVVLAFALARDGGISRKLLRGFLSLPVFAAVLAFPWYLRNWIALGSPIYPPPPLLLRWVHIKYMSNDAINALALTVRREGLGMGHSLWNLLLLPFNFTFHPANFLNGAGGVGVALLALAPLGVFARWRDPFVGALGLFSVMEVLGWFVSEQDARFLIHIYVLLAIFAVWGWKEVIAKSPRVGRVLAGAAIACSMLYGLMMILSGRVADVHAAVSPQFETARESRKIPYFESFAYLNGDPGVRKVLILEPRVPTFYLLKDYLKPIGRFGEQTVLEGNDFRLLASKLEVYGVTHILDVRLEHNRFRVPPNAPHLQLVFVQPDQRIYRVLREK